MKALVIAFLFISTAFAAEVKTDCPAMNHSREKIIKDVSAKKTRTGTRTISQ